MAEWDKKFARMVAETERHLASVKSQLNSRSSGSSVSGGNRSLDAHRNTSRLTSPYLTKSQSTPPSVLRSSSRSKNPSSNLATPLATGVKRNVSFEYSVPTTITSRSPTAVASSSSCGSGSAFTYPAKPSSPFSLLSEKLREQQKDVVELRESLNGMQFFLKQQHGQIMVLKDDMHSLQLRISESDVSSKTTRRLQKLKQEVMAEVEALERRVSTLSTRGVASHVTSPKKVSMSDEILTSKLQRNEDLRREVANLKSKIVTQESKVMGVVSGLREAQKSQEQTNKTVSELRGRWGMMEDHRGQLQEVRDLVSRLSDRLVDLEEAVFISHTKRSTPVPLPERSHTPFKASKPLAVHDLNISPISSVATGPRPLQRSTAGEGSAGNPLYSGASLRPSSSSLRAGGWGRVTGGRGNDDLELEADDLDDPTPSGYTLSCHTLSGHTLSCSLELMSDLDNYDDLNLDLSSEPESLT